MAGLNASAQRLRLDEAINSLIARFRCLPFDEFAARSYAPMAERARPAGQPIAMGDAQFAAIALANGIETVATRDTGPLEAMGLQVLDPWGRVAGRAPGGLLGEYRARRTVRALKKSNKINKLEIFHPERPYRTLKNRIDDK